MIGGLGDVANSERWQERAICSQVDPELFFPNKGQSSREAKKVCAECPVKAECLEYALTNHLTSGVYGGLSERERSKLKKPPRPTTLCVNGHQRVPGRRCVRCRREYHREYNRYRRGAA